jgi:hypothetical protein
MEAPAEVEVEVELDLSQIVVILARECDFLYIAPTFDDAVRYVDLYLSGPSADFSEDGTDTSGDGTGDNTGDGYPGGDAGEEPDGQMVRLTAEELEFFTAGGHTLAARPRDEQGRWALEVLDAEADPMTVQLIIRGRILGAFRAANERMVELGREEQVELPTDDCDYPTFIRLVMSDPKVGFDPRPNCSWLLRALGLC